MKGGSGVSKTNEVTPSRNSQFATRNFPALICFCILLTVCFLSAAWGNVINVTPDIENSELESANSESSISNEETSDPVPTRRGFQEWNNNAVPMMSRLFVWIGFIMSIGLTAKILTSFNDRQIGLMTVIFVGCVGALASMILLPMVYVGGGFKPVSPLGFSAAVLVAFLILLFYSKILHLFGQDEQQK